MAYTPPQVGSGNSAADVAYMYRQYADANGGDTEANRNAAIDYLRQNGVADSEIGSAYDSYLAKGGYQAPGEKDPYMIPGGFGGQMADARTPNTGGAGGGMGNAPSSESSGTVYKNQPLLLTEQPSVNLGMGGQNPYIGAYGNAITNQVTQNLSRNILPQIASGAMSAGGFGGSRQGVVEANALNDANQGLSNALAGAYSNDWNQQQGRNLSQYGMDQNYNLGMGNLGLNAQNSTNNFYTAQRGQDLQQAGLGASLAQMGNQGYLGQGQGMYNIGSTYNNAPWATMGNYGQTLQPWGSNTGSASSTSSTSSNPWANAIGGALLGGTFKLQ